MSNAFSTLPIKRALISVSDKTGIADIAAFLATHGVEIISTGGTASLLKKQGIDVIDIADFTGSPEILDGRVKTLHPKVHGGLLACLDDATHIETMEKHDIPSIDLVIVNLYPFESTVAKGADYQEVVENIDIGGPSMLRSSAKNHAFTTVICDSADYQALQQQMSENNMATNLAFRQKMAAKAFARTASYDAAIGAWFATQQQDEYPERLTLSATRHQTLRYGENPHQSAAFYVMYEQQGIAGATQLQGKALSYNNINDADAAYQLVQEFSDPAVAIIKHANPCGVAIGSNVADAYHKALACDPVSAFGGIIAINQSMNSDMADALKSMFLEAIIAPSFDEEALKILQAKKNLRLLVSQNSTNELEYSVRSVSGGLLIQSMDSKAISKDDLEVVTKRQPTEEEITSLLFAFKACKHVKSNAIVFAKDGATIGIGAGQMSRVDSVRIAAMKSADCKENPNRANGSVVASDAFFPFADGLELAAKAGVSAAIQPGGSIRDQEVIDAANAHDMAMVFTGQRHFRH